jgi:hypothetical protein
LHRLRLLGQDLELRFRERDDDKPIAIWPLLIPVETSLDNANWPPADSKVPD